MMAMRQAHALNSVACLSNQRFFGMPFPLQRKLIGNDARGDELRLNALSVRNQRNQVERLKATIRRGRGRQRMCDSTPTTSGAR